MANVDEIERCNTWIADEQTIHEKADYGSNQKSVGDALEEQKRRTRMVQAYTNEVDKAAQNAKDKAAEDQLKASYDSLEAVSKERSTSLEGLAEIASLEEDINAVSNKIVQTATKLVLDSTNQAKTPQNVDNGITRVAQGSTLAVFKNWQWIITLMKCTDTHLQHSKNYHEFYKEANEFIQWMPAGLAKATDKVQIRHDLSDNTTYAKKLYYELKGVLALFLCWEAKVNCLFNRSRSIVPLNLRTMEMEQDIPVKSLCDYKTNEINMTEGEDLTLLDNSDTSSWLVRNIHLQEAMVPAVTCVISGPDEEAVQLAMRLRLQLLSMWTANIKRIGKTLINFLLVMFVDWTDKEAKHVKAMSNTQKNQVSDTLDCVEHTFLQYWAEYPDFKTLQQRIAVLRKLLAQPEESKDQSDSVSQSLVAQTKVVQDLLKKYQDFWRSWMTFKILTESSKHPEVILIVDKWQELEFIELTELIKKWHIGFDFAEDQVDGKTATSRKFSETAEAESYSRSEQESRKRFVITGVTDPRSNKILSMHEAIELGIINNNDGTYVNPDTKVTKTINEAMSEGFIKGELISAKMSEEKTKEIGLVKIVAEEDVFEADVVTKSKESKSYAIRTVVDQVQMEKVSYDEAIKRKLINIEDITYRNNKTEEVIGMEEAIKRGLIKATLVDEPTSMDIATENLVVIEKIGVVERKLMGPLKTVAALKKAGKSGEKLSQ